MAEALKLMLTGMSTVFLILIFVVLLGNLIILVTNKYSGTSGALTAGSGSTNQNIDPKKLAAIVTAVDMVTGGKGRVESVKKSEQ